MASTISQSAPTALNMDYAQETIEHDGEKIIKPMLIQNHFYSYKCFYIICIDYDL